MSPDNSSFRSDRGQRLIEVGLSIIAASVSSAIVATWTISSTLAKMDARIEANAQAITATRLSVDTIGGRDMVQQAQLAAQEAHYQDIARRLDGIDRKLEEWHYPPKVGAR